MNANSQSSRDRIWAMIDEERRRDDSLRRISKIAWIVTIALVVGYGVLTAVQIAQIMQSGFAGLFPFSMTLTMIRPLLMVLGGLSVLVATLTTIGTFVRTRTTSLHELQLRLATLEELLVARMDTK